MNPLHDKEQRLIQQYRATTSPRDLSIDVSRFHSESLLHKWFSMKPIGLASALMLAIFLFLMADQDSLHINETGLTPSISYLSASGVSLSIDNIGPDMYDIQSSPGLLDISIPYQDNDAEKTLPGSAPHQTNNDSLFIASSKENDNELFNS